MRGIWLFCLRVGRRMHRERWWGGGRQEPLSGLGAVEAGIDDGHEGEVRWGDVG